LALLLLRRETEKLHGTMCAVSYQPGLGCGDVEEGDTLVYSKDLARTGHALKASNETNLYLNTARGMMMRERLRRAFNGRPATVFGEIYGATIQDLGYGRATPSFAAFDIYLGRPGAGHWLSRPEFNRIVGEVAPAVPTLYAGPLQGATLKKLASGATVAGNMAHIREGVVVRTVSDRNVYGFGRAVLKYVSPEYMTRRGGTEFQ
jgi:RNA ligase (TIGR02306 family)